MKHSSIKLNTPCELINVTPLNPLISKCQIKVCYVGDQPNRNKSIITKEVARGIANSLPGSPIVGYFNETEQDFEEHNRELIIKDGKIVVKDTTRPYGFVDLNANVWFQKFLDDGQYEREYLMTEGWLWTGQYPECKRILTEGNNHSMELDKQIIDAHWTKDKNGNPQFFIINEAIMSKLCILGENYEPCFEGSNITAPNVEFSFDEGFKEQLFSMINEIKEILNEGGASVGIEDTKVDEVIVEEEGAPAVAEEETPAVADATVPEEVTTEPEGESVDPAAAGEEIVESSEEEDGEEICPECHNSVNECECDEDKKDEYILDEIPEYVELRDKYSNLENQYTELQTQYSALNEQLNVLTSFKQQVEKKEKQAMIDSFYMLSDADKAEVSARIDEYSLEDIEAKLSIICVRNKVNFNLDDDNSQTNPTVYNLNSGDIAEENVPAWIKALQSVAKSMN